MHAQFGKKKKGGSVETGNWLVSFADVNMTLMCFFVLIISMSTIDKNRYDNVKEGMKSQKNVASRETLESLAAKLRTEIKAKKLENFAEVGLDADGLKIELKDKLLFSSGSDEPNEAAKQQVEGILSIISHSPDRYHILIEGHTDDVPMKSRRFPTNWELSSARGVAILKRLESFGVADNRTSVMAYAHTRPKYPFANLKGEALNKVRAGNRRVVIRME